MNREASKHFSKVGFVYFIGSIIFMGVQVVAIKFIQQFMPTIAADQTLLFLIPMLATYMVGVPLMMFIISRIPVKKQMKTCKMTKKQWVVTFLICYAGMYLANLAGTMVTTTIGRLKDTTIPNELLEILFSNGMWANLLVIVLLAPIIEELLFRKMLIDRTIQYGEGISVFLSALFFGLFHGNLNQFAYAFVIGGIFGFVYVKTGNVKYTIGMHMLINFMGSAISTGLMKLAGLDELFVKISDASGQINPLDVMNIFVSHIAGWILLVIYAMVILVLVSIGVVLFFKNISKIHLVSTEDTVEKDQRFRTYFLNVGMMLFCMLWGAFILCRLIF